METTFHLKEIQEAMSSAKIDPIKAAWALALLTIEEHERRLYAMEMMGFSKHRLIEAKLIEED